ncbi:hypothetical protein QTP70_000742 [Hemibagrus guttatus]|uniref:Ig-like domain-containing protein n=1 Tax=Hemibagrus guttatus TaxID=175788 RepID=A0AAE0UQE6_9TELE|nr:hypothetical protein QTP70_000742 [Hemibagrus guttatus]
MRVSTSKSEAMVLNRKKVAYTLQVGGEVLPQVEEFKYLGVLFTSEGRMDRETDRQIGAAAAVMRSMYRFVVVKKELSRKAKLSIYQSIYVPTLTYGHELWVMTERVRSRIQAAEMSFLRRVAGRSLRDRVELCHTRGARSRAAAPPHRKGAVEVAWASVSDASRTSPWRGVPGMPHREEAPGKTQDTLERLCLLAGLGTPRGVLTQDRGWSVEYPDKLICAVRGFSVSIPCSCSYPQNYQFVWSKNNQRLNTSGPVLHFPALTVRDSGNYTCTWKTGETSGSETISLHVEDEDPENPENPEHWLIWVIVLVIVGVSVFVSVAVIHNRRRKVKVTEENVEESGEKTRTKPQFSSQVSHVADEEMLNKEEVTYSSVQKKAATKGSQLNRDPQPDEEDEGGVVYAPVWIKPNKATKQGRHSKSSLSTYPYLLHPQHLHPLASYPH